MIGHVYMLFSPEESGEPSTSAPRIASRSVDVVQRRFSMSTTATSGTHFDPDNPVHQLTKDTFLLLRRMFRPLARTTVA